MKRHLVFFTILVVVFIFLIWLYFLFVHPWTAPTTGELFLQNLLESREAEAVAYISEDLYQLSLTSCAGGMIINCASAFLEPTWEEVRQIHFVIGNEYHNSMLYHVYFDDEIVPISIVLIYSNAQEGARIVGWRGFVISQGEDADKGLLNGSITTNSFGNMS